MPSLTAPYSLKLSDYSQPGSQRLVTTIMVNDVTISNLPVRLHLKMETLTGVTIETVPNISTRPLFLNGGEVSILFGDDMADYFNINNLQFTGYTKDDYRRTGQLPEGFYRFTVEVRHYSTGRLISNQGKAMAWIALGKPPILKTPDNKATLGQIAGMPLTFSWVNATAGIPTAGTQYTFELWEMRIPGIAPEVVVASMPVFYSTTQFTTSLVVHPAELLLEPGMSYAWRVTASDMGGQVQYSNDGKSEVRMFTYQCACEKVSDLKLSVSGPELSIRWQPDGRHTSFRIEGNNPESGWAKEYESNDAGITLRAEEGKTYRFRVQGVCDGGATTGEFSNWETIEIPRKKPFVLGEDCPDCACGESEPGPPITNFTLRKDLQPGDTIQNSSGNSRFILKTVEQQSDGVYKGQFLFWIEIWGIKVLCDYWDLQVNTDNVMVKYNFESVYNPQFLVDVDKAKEYFDNLKDAVDNLTSGNNLTNNNTNKGADQTVDFIIPENPEYYYDAKSGTLVIFDKDNNPHVVELPKKEDGTVNLPATIADASGKVYEVKKEDGQTRVELSRNQPSNNDNKTSSDNDLYMYFIIQRLNPEESVNVEMAEKIAKETPTEKYYSSGNKILLDEGKYLCIPVHKNLSYKNTNDSIIIKGVNNFHLYGQITSTGYKLLSWTENPYNTYQIQQIRHRNNIQLQEYANYIVLDLPGGVMDSVAVAVPAQANPNSDFSVYGYGDGQYENPPQQVSLYEEALRKMVRNITPYHYTGSLKIQVEKRDMEAVWFDLPNQLYDGHFGFDRYSDQKLSAFKTKYELLNITKSDGSKIDYRVPYISAWGDESVTIKALIQANPSGADVEYIFDPGTGGLAISCNHEAYKNGVFKAPNGNYELEMTLKGVKSDVAVKYTLLVKDRGGKIVGKLYFYSKNREKAQSINYQVVNVTFGSTPSNITPIEVDLNNYSEGSSLENYFNQNSFNQAFIQFKNKNKSQLRHLVITDAEIRAKGITSNSAIELDSTKNNWGKIQDLLESKYGNVSTANERIIFLINNRTMTEVLGFADTPGNYIVIFNPALTNWGILTHETGHTFGLKHPFDTNGFIKGNSTNFMDYTPKRNMFWKWQWEIINTKDF
ncbi:hypothetical protein FACS1894182_10760 [Bacteroidia bacterium]|nr:hypothetical protein FACS1894182_10760 [Bacteroidia bacterium]